MQFSAIFIASLLGLAAAAPAAEAGVEARQITSVRLTFSGAAAAQYFVDVPTDGSAVTINHPEISVSKIYNPGGAICYSTGSTGQTTYVPINEHDVGPPTPQVSVRCYHL